MSPRRFLQLPILIIILTIDTSSARGQSVCVQPPSGAIAWWSFDEASGTISADRVGDHPGAWSNEPVPAPGEVRGALRFNGTNYVTVQNSDLWHFGANNFTIELWANFDAPPGGSIGEPDDIFIGNDEGPGNLNKWFFAVGAGFLNFHINSPALGPMFFPLVPFSPVVGQWYHLAVVRMGRNYTIFINGAPSGSATNANVIPNPNAPLTIGQAENLGFMKGRLDEVTIYNRALAPEEIAAIYNSDSAGKCVNIGILPSTGGDSGVVTVHVTGTGFAQGAGLKLVGLDFTDIVATNVTVAGDGTALDGTLNLVGQPQGSRNVVVTDPGGVSFTLDNGFMIQQTIPPQVWVDVIGLPVFRPGIRESVQVLYGNTGNVDVSDSMIWVSGFPQSAALTVDGVIPLSSPPQPFATLSPGIPLTYEISDPGVLAIRTGRIKAEAAGSLDLSFVTSSFAPQTLSSAAFFGDEDVGVPPSQPCLLTDPNCVSPADQSALEQALGLAWRNWPRDNLFTQSFATRGLCIGAAAALEADMEQASLQANSSLKGWGFQLVNGCGVFNSEGRREHDDTMITSPNTGDSWLIDDAVYPMVCRMIPLGSNSWSTPGCGVFSACTWKLDTSAPGLPCRLPQQGGSLVQQPVSSFDPNSKVGSSGTGALAYISGQQPLRYSVSFENLPTATAPAQQVVISDQLDASKMDMSTLSLGPIAFGSHQVIPTPGNSTFAGEVDLRPTTDVIVSITASLNPNTGVVTWRLSSIDPSTGNPLTDPRVGFLPPDVNPPSGDGRIVFTVMPKKGLLTNTQIQNQATIVFDGNPPISTPTWLNTLDNTPPVSTLSPLPVTEPTTGFTVSWSGSDVGAGIQDFTIYVSDDAGPFTVWQKNTTATSASFIGQSGHTYGFYSIARDLVGNIELAKTSAEATTQVTTDTTPPVTIAAVSPAPNANGWNNANVAITLNSTDSEPGGTGVKQITYSAAGAQTIASTAVNGASASFTINTEGITTISFLGTDNAGNVESAHTLTIQLDKTPPTLTCAASPNVLWPANNKLVPVNVSVTVSDTLSGSAGFTLVSVTSNEPDSGQGDIQDFVTESASTSGQLRAQRLGSGTGRVYTFMYSGSDRAGNTSSCTTTVTVPHDQGQN